MELDLESVSERVVRSLFEYRDKDERFVLHKRHSYFADEILVEMYRNPKLGQMLARRYSELYMKDERT